VTALLKRGLTTTSAGGFFFIPYLLQLGGHGLASSLGPAKRKGIPRDRIALGIVFESIFGYTAGIRAVDSVSRADFGLLAGLPFLPSSATQYRFLQRVPVRQALDFQTALGKRLVWLGQITPGLPVNVDRHNLKTYSRKEMKLSFITKEDKSYQLKGSFDYLTEGKIYDDMKPWNPAKHPGHAAAALRIEAAYSGAEKLL